MSERRSELKAVAAGEDIAAKASERDLMQMTARMMDGWSQVQGRLMTLAQASVRNNLSAAEELRQCQSANDLMDCQMRLARQNYDEAVDGARQIGDIMVRMSTDAMGYLGLPR
ncbi:MAG: phasin family protein [Pseudomonadota bacterium]